MNTSRPQNRRLIQLAIWVMMLALTFQPVTSSAAPVIPGLLVPPRPIARLHPEFVRERREILQDRGQLHGMVTLFDQQCDNDNTFDNGQALNKACAQRWTGLLRDMRAHVATSNDFNNRLRAAMAAYYRPSGNALIGGAGWIAGYNVQTADPKIVARARAMLKKQMSLADKRYDDAIDFKRYNFVVGIAASTNEFKDLADRVLFDQLSNGQASASLQNTYNLLTRRSFGELGCHSNGAMICLAALENQDVLAQRVVLYGPQITRESLQMWNALVSARQVQSVEIAINRGDPVPRFSLLFGNPRESTDPSEFLPLKEVLHKFAPDVNVIVYPCSDLPDLKCHDMKVYKKNRG